MQGSSTGKKLVLIRIPVGAGGGGGGKKVLYGETPPPPPPEIQTLTIVDRIGNGTLFKYLQVQALSYSFGLFERF